MDVRCCNTGDAEHATEVRCLAVVERGHLDGAFHGGAITSAGGHARGLML